MNNTIGFIGAGNMGSALIKAVCNNNNEAHVMAYDHHLDRLHDLAQTLGFSVAQDIQQIVASCRYVVLGVKPCDMTSLLEEVAACIAKREHPGATPVVVSLAAGYSLAACTQVLEPICDQIPLIRLMPNSGVDVGAGVCLFAASDAVAQQDTDDLMALFAQAGMCAQVTEDQLAAAIPIFSCSPAYVYMFMEALADAGTQLGLEHDFAAQLASQAVQGSACKALTYKKNFAELREEISTPGGMTIAATNYMEEKGLRAAVIGGALKAFEQSKNMR